MKPTWRRLTRLTLILAALVLSLAACGGDDEDEATATTEAATTEETTEEETTGDKGATTIVIGTKNFTEEFILGELYAQALEAKGYTVELKKNIGSTEIIDKALTSGEINFYPEYTGTALTVVHGSETSEESAEATYEAAKEAYEERGQTLLAMTPFSDSDALAMRSADAEAEGIEAIGDLKDFKGGAFKLGGQPEFKTRAQGLPGLEQNYGLTDITFVPFAGISPYEALDQKTVDVAAIFSTDPPLASGKYVVLEDTEAQFGFQNVAPVVDQEVVDALGDDFVETVDAVSEALTEEAIIAMNSAVAIDQQPEAEVAKQFLEENALLES
jgi:osmoprotectant transport system substrate-binding protein